MAESTEPPEQSERFKAARPIGDPLVFADLDQLKDFCRAELEFWDWLKKHAGAQPAIRGPWDELRTHLTHLQDFADQWRNTSDKTERQSLRGRIESGLRSLASGSFWLSREDPRGQYIKQLSEEGDKTIAAFVWLAFLGRAVPVTVTNAVEGLVHALLYNHALTADTAKAEKSALDEVRNLWHGFAGSAKEDYERFRQQFDQLQTQIQELRDQQKKQFDEFLSEARSELDAIAKTYDEKLALEAPVTYWQTRADDHKKRSWIFAGSFVAVAAVVLMTLVKASAVSLPELWQGEIIQGSRYGTLAVLGGVAAFLIWPLRILARLLLSNLHLGTDAEERVTMANTYLSLLRSESGLEESDRKLILEALFRPVNIGIVKDDGAGLSPVTVASRMGSGDRK